MKSKTLPEIQFRAATNDDAEKIRALVFGVLAEFGMKGELAGTDSDLADIETSYIDSGGLFEVIEDQHGTMLGTVGLFPLRENVCELRKMYFIKEIRGMGLGKYVLERTIQHAKKLGYKRIELETASVLEKASRLYERYGFKPLTGREISCRCDKAYYLDL